MNDSSKAHTSRAIPFLAAFNNIESHLRAVLNAKRSDSFWWMVDRARDHHMLSARQAEVLKDYGNLRNAISHGRYNDGQTIAEPHPQVVKEIENLERLLTNPPAALDILGQARVETLASNDSINSALKLIRTKGYSQIPIYDAGNFTALLTTNVITHWVAADLADNNHLDARTVGEVLRFGEPVDRAVFLPRNASAQEALDAALDPGKDGTHAFAVILTEKGKPNQAPLRIITSSDLAALLEAVEWE